MRWTTSRRCSRALSTTARSIGRPFRKTRAGLPSPTLEFYDAGHALGSAGVMVRGQKETLFYTGDVCFHDQTILKSRPLSKMCRPMC